MMATLGCMRDYLTRMVSVGMLGMALGGAALMVSPAAWANEIKTDAASSESPVPNATYDESQPGANDPSVKEGFAAYQAGDFKEAYDIWLPLAEAGNAEAQFRVGRLHSRGEGTAKSGKIAIFWYELAIQMNHSSAAFNLGVIYRRGKLVSQNIKLAEKYYLISSMLGDVDAQFNLGILYAISDPPHQDFVEAYKWFYISIRNGDVEAMDAISDLNKFASLEQRHLGLKRMREWFENHPRQ